MSGRAIFHQLTGLANCAFLGYLFCQDKTSLLWIPHGTAYGMLLGVLMFTAVNSCFLSLVFTVLDHKKKASR